MMICYNKDGPICRYCIPQTFTTRKVYGMPRYECTHPLEGDEFIDPNREADCPEKYKRVDQ